MAAENTAGAQTGTVELVDGVLSCRRPPNPLPIIFDIPQSGTDYPEDFLPDVPFCDMHFLVSPYVSELLADAGKFGITLLQALFPMSFINVNRSVSDLDPEMLAERWPGAVEPSEKIGIGIGLIQKWAKPGVDIYARKLTNAEIQNRIENFYDPYHARLASILAGFKAEFGAAWHLDCHCMGSVGSLMSPDPGRKRADFCIGDRDGTTSDHDFLECIESLLQSMGYRVSINIPFKGVEIIRRHGRPAEKIHSLQLEIGRGLFLDETTNIRSARFGSLRRDLEKLAGGIAAFVREKLAAKARQ